MLATLFRGGLCPSPLMLSVPGGRRGIWRRPRLVFCERLRSGIGGQSITLRAQPDDSLDDCGLTARFGVPSEMVKNDFSGGDQSA